MCKWWKSIHTHECALQSWNVFFAWKLFPLPQWLSILFLSSVLFLSLQFRWGEIPLSSRFQQCLTGTKCSFHDSVERTSTEIPGLQKNNLRNLTALWFFVEIGKWQHHSVELYQFFFSASWGCHSGPAKLWFIFSLYGYFPAVLQSSITCKNTEWSSESHRCKEKIVSCFGVPW